MLGAVGGGVVGGVVVVVVEGGLEGGGFLDVEGDSTSTVVGLQSSSEEVVVTCSVLFVTFTVVNSVVFVVLIDSVEDWLVDV